jgi:hypothetical protein
MQREPEADSAATDEPQPVWDRIASDEYISALGRVVYEANRLETTAAEHWFNHAYMSGKQPHLKYPSAPQALTIRMPVAALIKVLKEIEPKTDRERKHLDCAQQAERLLNRRHEYTHVIYVRFGDSPVIAMHVNSDGQSGSYSTLDSPQELLDLAAEMLAHRHAGERLDRPPEFEEAIASMPPPRPRALGSSSCRDPTRSKLIHLN